MLRRKRRGMQPIAIQQSRGLRVQRGQKVHQVWAVDAKERMRLVDGSDACWLVVTDEASGAILQAEHFPPETLDTDEGNNGATVFPTSL